MAETPSDSLSKRRATIKEWFEDLRTGSQEENEATTEVYSWSFMLSPQEQWPLILEMIELAPDDECLGHIAAGPLEELLGGHGEEFIDRVEEQAARDHKFARTLTNVWQHGMSDGLYGRIKGLQAQVTDPLQLKCVSWKEEQAVQQQLETLLRAWPELLRGMDAFARLEETARKWGDSIRIKSEDEHA